VLPLSDVGSLRLIVDAQLQGRSGVRLQSGAALSSLLAVDGGVGTLAVEALGSETRPVRAILFDKTEQTNWAVGWHQDRTIAVAEQRDVPGFGPWSVKSGVVHVEPPYAVFASMVTLRVHLDACDAENAPLLIAPGSHKLGRIAAADAAGVAERLGVEPCFAEAGDVWIYATGLIHASGRAHQPRRRRVLHVDYANIDLPDGLMWHGL
jgi:hypothetical protein